MTDDEQMTYLREAMRGGLQDMLDAWLGKARPLLETLTRAACDPSVSDEDLRSLVSAFLASGQLLKAMNPAALAEYLEDGMGTAAALGKCQAPPISTNERSTDPASGFRHAGPRPAGVPVPGLEKSNGRGREKRPD